MKALYRILLFVLLAVIVAHAPVEAQSSPRKDRNRISAEEIQAATAQDAHQLVQRLRPHWLRMRGRSSLQTREAEMPGGGTGQVLAPREIIVYLNGGRYGTHESLRSLHLDGITDMEYMDGPSATQRFGTGHPHGAILVTIRNP
jgi:hypothetical protein